MKITTICFLIKDDKVCLGMKKRGFGAGKWNGFGGKVGDKEVNKDETIEESVIREAGEEFNIIPKQLNKVAQIFFKFPSQPEWGQHCHIFLIPKWKGEPTESEEMQPGWFSFDKLPFDRMWPYDKLWIPRILAGEKLVANFEFDKDNKITKQEIKTA